MRVDQCRAGVVVCHDETGVFGTIVCGGYRPRVFWHAAGRGFRVEEGLLRFVAPDEATYRTARGALAQQRETPGERSYAAAEVEAIIRRTWEVALRAGMQWVRDKTMRGYDLDRFVEEVLEHRSEER